MGLHERERAQLARLAALLERAESAGAASLSPRELVLLPRMYRFASSLFARLGTRGSESASDRRAIQDLRSLLLAAHGFLYRARARGWAARGRALLSILGGAAPRAVRAEWRLLAASAVALYGLSAIAFALVSSDLALAYSLMQPEHVDAQMAQLRAVEEGQPFRGNFTFGLEQSPTAAGRIIGNNLRVASLFFASSLLPPLYLLVLAQNALMLGTYTAVAAHWGQAGSIASILWCHGALEIQALVLAGAAGSVLLRGWIAPGESTRGAALRREGRRALELLAPVLPMLVLAGLIEGFVSPHAPFALRIAVASVSLAGLLAWALLCGRHPATEADTTS